MIYLAQGLKKEKTFLIFLFFISFFIRALFFNFFLKEKDLLCYDSAVYDGVAQQFSRGNGIVNSDGSLHFLRVPGYSIFLALGYKFFSDDIKKNLWIQIIITSLIPLLIFCLSLIFFPKVILLAKICSLIGTFNLGFVIFSSFVMSEGLFVLFFLMFLILFLSNFELFFSKKLISISLSKAFAAGIFLGLSSMFRPVGQYLIILSVLLLLFSNMSFPLKIKSSFALFSGWFLIVIPWLLRNLILTGCLFFHTLPGIHFLKHSAARIEMERVGCSYIRALATVTNDFDVLVKKIETKRDSKLNAIESCLCAEKVSKEYFKNNIFLALKHFFLNMFKTCFSLYSAELLFFDSDGYLPDYVKGRNIFLRFLFPQVSNKILLPIIYLEIIFLLLLWIGFVGFVFMSFSNKETFCIITKVLPFIIFFIVISLACGFARLRLPVEALLIIFSSKFWYDFLFGLLSE